MKLTRRTPSVYRSSCRRYSLAKPLVPACLVAFLAAALGGCASTPDPTERVYEICPDVKVVQRREEDEDWEQRISLTDNERLLVCGDPKAKNTKYSAWTEIPFNQAKFHFSTFLQSRGYYQAEFRRVAGHLRVELGPFTQVTSVGTQGAPDFLDIGRKRDILGKALTPLLLDEVELWVRGELRSEGYPCPDVEAKADPVTGQVVVKVTPGPLLRLNRVVEEPIEGMRAAMLRRYDAFQLGELYDADLLTLTSRRILRDGIVQSVYFTETCEPSGAVARQITVAGEPRLLVFGVGVDAEGLIRLKASWKNTRLGRSASVFEVTAFGSTLEQSLDATFTWYHLPHPSRRFIRPTVQVSRIDEEPYELLSRKIRVSTGTSWDTQELGLDFQIGPAYEWLKTLRGVGPTDSNFPSLESTVRLISHDFEFFQASPRTGYSLVALTDFASRGVGSDFTAQKAQILAEGLWNFSRYDPPLIVFGLRTGLFATATSGEAAAESNLPPIYHYYLGSSQDLRGFGRNEVTLTGNLGGLSAAFAGFELRVAALLPENLQPFGFVDAGALGRRSFSLQRPIYWSPGVGLRWESPFGTFRGTLAHGYVSGQPDSELSHLQFYFSFGEEF